MSRTRHLPIDRESITWNSDWWESSNNLTSRFARIILDTREEDRARRWRVLPALEWWETVREEVIVPAVIAARDALEAAGLTGRMGGLNSSGKFLEAEWNNGGTRGYLSFEWRPEHEWVDINSTVKELRHAWTRAYFSEAEIVAVLEQFLEAVAREEGVTWGAWNPRAPG